MHTAAVKVVPKTGWARKALAFTGVALRWLHRMMTLIPFVLLHVGVFTVFAVPITWTAVGLFAGLYALRVWALTAGFHRYFAHRAYKTSRWFQFMLGVLGCSAAQKGMLWWAGHHRRHHDFSDQEGDPHSPITRSVWWSHVGWVMDKEQSYTDWDRMKEWLEYWELRWLNKFHFIPFLILGGICWWIDGISGLVWGWVVSTVCVYHSTFLVNSACHLFGYRRFDTNDYSRNNWWVALLTFGEGWHNNHHHYMSSARQGFEWWEIDISYIILRGLAKVGLVWDLREPTPKALAKGRVA